MPARRAVKRATTRKSRAAQSARRRISGNAYYRAVLELLRRKRIPFLVGGTCAVNVYLGTSRDLKDLDLFCVAGDYPRILKACHEAGYQTQIEDERWIAKVHHDGYYVDVIFGSANALTPVTPSWFEHVHESKAFGIPIRVVPPTEMVLSKTFVADKQRFDGNEVAQLILKRHEQIDWRRLLGYMEPHWEVLLMHLVRFRYIYPSERGSVPQWLLDELMSRVENQRGLPPPRRKVCRGRFFSRMDFVVDVTQWGFADVVGDEARA